MSILFASPAVNETSKKMSQSFPREARLLKHADFQVVYKKGRKHFSGNMTAFYRQTGLRRTACRLYRRQGAGRSRGA